MNQEEIIKEIEAESLRKNITRYRISKISGVEESTIKKIFENSTQRPEFSTIVKLASAVGYDLKLNKKVK